jgi:integrase
VWVTRDGTPRRPDGNAGEVFRDGCDALKLKGERGRPFTIHCLRDTFATTHIMRDYESLGWVSQMLGHAQESTTRDRYYRWVEIAKGRRRQLANSIRGKRANGIAEGRK